MSSYSEEYEAIRQRHRQAVAEKRLADRHAQINALGRQPDPPLQAVPKEPTPALQAVPPARPALPPARLPDTRVLPTPLPLPVQEDWSPGARPGQAWLGYYADTFRSHTAAPEEALLPKAVMGHTLVVGATRMGKTRLLLLLAGEALANGASVAALDLKGANFTLGRLCAVADAAGLRRQDRTLFLPSVSPGPGWNPLLEGREAVGEILGVFKALAGTSWGPKMDTLFRSALTLLAERRLSLFELPSLISRPAYAKALTGSAAQSHLGQYLLDRVTGRDADTDPVLNKLLPVLDIPFFEQCLCAERNTFSMGSLWKRQQLACFHLDRKRLSEEGAGALGALAARRMLAAAIEPAGSGRVVLLADEAGEIDRLSGGRMERTLSEGGESRLSLLLACQYLSQLSGNLRESALTNAGLKCFFRLGPEDARHVDRVMGNNWGSRTADLGPQHCLVQVGEGTPRIVRVADLDPQPAPGWEHQGARLYTDEWEGLPERRRAGIQTVIGNSLPRLDTPTGNWGRKGQASPRLSTNSEDGESRVRGYEGKGTDRRPQDQPDEEGGISPKADYSAPNHIDWSSDGLS